MFTQPAVSGAGAGAGEVDSWFSDSGAGAGVGAVLIVAPEASALKSSPSTVHPDQLLRRAFASDVSIVSFHLSFT